MKELFPDCEVGAEPPVGTLYGLDVYVDRSLTVEPEIYFPAGSHHEVIRMRFGLGVAREHTLEEVGQVLSVTRERIRQTENRALKKLKYTRRRRWLRFLLGKEGQRRHALAS